MFAVNVEKFEGPLDLLLSLIESEKLDICEVSLSKITASYLNKVEELPGTSEEIADFLVVAAKLLYLKSRELLPEIQSQEEDAEIAELEQNLIEYQQYKKAAEELDAILSKNYRSYPRRGSYTPDNIFFPPKDISQEKLWDLFQESLNKIKERPKTEVINPVKVTLEDRKALLKYHLSKGTVSLRKILTNTGSKVEIIVTFLALLELVKLREIRVDQTGNFGDLTLFRLK